MMRALLLVLAALVLGAIAGQLMMDDPGYVLVTWHRYVLETSLWVGIALALVALLATLAALGLLESLVGAVDHFRQWRLARRGERARALTVQGLAQYAEGDWRKATITLLKAAELVDDPLLVRLKGARAAEEDGRGALAEQILREARAGAGDAAPLVDLRLAALRLRQGDAAGARPLLERLREKFPKHARAVALLRDCLEQLGDWQALTALLPALRRQLGDSDWQALARRAWTNRLAAVAAEAGYPSRKARIEALLGAWKAVPADFRDDAVTVRACTELLARHDAPGEALALLERTLSREWDDELVALYGRLDAEEPLAQLNATEKWLTMRPTNAALLLAAGRASLRNKLWGKARDYFEASAARQSTPEVCAELVRLYSRLGETARVDQYLRRHAELTGAALPKLPLPTARL